jgi:hypothetical protein
MPDSNEDTIKGVGKLFGVMAKLKLKLRAECSVVVKVLSEMFMTLFLGDVAGCSGVSFCDSLFFALLPIAISAQRCGEECRMILY